MRSTFLGAPCKMILVSGGLYLGSPYLEKWTHMDCMCMVLSWSVHASRLIIRNRREYESSRDKVSGFLRS